MKSARMHVCSVAVALSALLSIASATQIVYIDQLRAKAAALQGAPHPEVAAFGNMAQAFILQLEAAPGETAPPVHIPVPVSLPASTMTVTVVGPASTVTRMGPAPAAVTVTTTVAGQCAPAQEAPRTVAVPGYAPPVGVPSAVHPVVTREVSSAGARETAAAVVTRTVVRITTVTCEEERAGGAGTTMVTRTRGAVEAAATEPCDE